MPSTPATPSTVSTTPAATALSARPPSAARRPRPGRQGVVSAPGAAVASSPARRTVRTTSSHQASAAVSANSAATASVTPRRISGNAPSRSRALASRRDNDPLGQPSSRRSLDVRAALEVAQHQRVAILRRQGRHLFARRAAAAPRRSAASSGSGSASCTGGGGNSGRPSDWSRSLRAMRNVTPYSHGPRRSRWRSAPPVGPAQEGSLKASSTSWWRASSQQHSPTPAGRAAGRIRRANAASSRQVTNAEQVVIAASGRLTPARR